ncbi:MAG: hypothetical protein ACLSAZ_24430 [Blautia wexlerae]
MKKLLISILSGIIFITNATSIYANAPGVVELGKIDDVTSAIKFSEEMAAIEQEDLWGFIDKTGSIIIIFHLSAKGTDGVMKPVG